MDFSGNDWSDQQSQGEPFDNLQTITMLVVSALILDASQHFKRRLF